MPNLKTTNATLRHALIRKGVYLPDHNKRKTSLHYIKKVMAGSKKYLFTKEILFVEVPHYDELKPENLISACGLK